MKKRIFSGIQPSGVVHIGNYLGAMKNWVEMQNSGKYENVFCIVDLHAITVPQEPKKLQENIHSMMALLLAIGLDPKKSLLFIQSQVPEHAELTWILNTITYMGELERMTQFKDKSQISNLKSQNVGVGLFDYPVLMAADILLYDTDLVPVGEDQKQHVELARDLAKRFNNRFGQIFKVPQPLIRKEGCRIMGLDDPTKKMSKSALSEYNYIVLTDEPDVIHKKIAKAVTDSGTEVKFNPARPGLYNLLTIYQLFSELALPQIEKQFVGKGYSGLKKALAELLIEKLAPIQKQYQKYLADKSELEKIYSSGATSAQKIAEKKIKEVKDKIGLN